ncbi:MAG: flagellar hook-length control protein FliK [Proteobacteria bacterium]|nr:flagellar hook-length control protein FliK [Pseudomonadota bacterium]MBU1388958.1 flagellar hook-length control protein FliK [Pseudomonadota bacterium]MBU1543510.1 flagellar hook-length control protein FliK [Pseudomonadota bacterium]MBU2482613.1 flagellar hook-length control protein FliK [Pseudomonadota bacterium]
MNFSFADASNVFMDMVQSEFPKTGMLDGKATESGKQGFAEKLNKTMEKIQDSSCRDGSGNPRSDQADSDKMSAYTVGAGQSDINPVSTRKTDALDKKTKDQNLPSDDGIQNILEKLSRKKGAEFVAALKNVFFALSEGNLKNLSIDAEGLEALKKMLLKAGFKESDLDKLIAELSSESESNLLSDGLLSLDAFFDKLLESLSELSIEENNQIGGNEEIFMLSSTIPFLQSILSSMSIPQEKIREILELSDKGDKGISLDTVIENLKSIQKTAFYSSEQYQTKDNDKNIAQILGQLGLDANGNKSSAFSLDDLIRSLEAVRSQTKSSTATAFSQDLQLKAATDEKPMDLLAALFKGIKTKSETIEKASPFEFSADRIKNEFKNAAVGMNADKPALKPQTEAGNPLHQAAKEMASVLGEKAQTPADKSDQSRLKEIETVLKHNSSRGVKSTENSQVSASDSKSSQAVQNLNHLKANMPLRNLPTYVTHQVTKGLVRAINQGENTLRLQLNPPELGRLMMTIDKSGDVMRVSIVTESLAAKEILTSNATELKAVLSASGVTLEKFEVDMNSDFRQSMADANNHAKDSSKRNHHREKSGFGVDSTEGINDAGNLLNSLNHEGSLHFVA